MVFTMHRSDVLRKCLTSGVTGEGVHGCMGEGGRGSLGAWDGASCVIAGRNHNHGPTTLPPSLGVVLDSWILRDEFSIYFSIMSYWLMIYL